MSNEQITAPTWLIDAVPGAREAADKYLALVTDSAPFSRAVQVAMQARMPLSKWHANGGSARLGPADGVTTADFEAGNHRLAEAEAAQADHARKVRAALDAYHALMWAFPKEKRAPLAASVALAKHERVVELWDELARVIVERDRAWASAGRPGRAWDTLNEAPTGGASYVLDRIATVMKAVVGGFDSEALRLVAGGGTVAPVNPIDGNAILHVRSGLR